MKKVFAIAIAALVAGTSFAQKGSILVYGNATLVTSKDAGKNKSNTFDLAPGVGYQVDKNWTAGLGFSLSSSNVKSDAGTELSKNSGFAFGPFVRYTKSLSSTFSVFGQFDAMFGTSKSGVAVETKTNTMNLAVTPAVSVNVSKRMAMNFSFGGLGYGTSKADVSGANTTSSLYLTFGRSANIGVQWAF